MRPARRNVLLAGIGAAAAAAGAVVGALVLQFRSGAADLLSASLPDLRGRRHRLVDLQGRVVLCNFWATWCAPCREEVPLLVAAQRQYRPNGLEVVGIGLDSAANIAEFAANYKMNYLVLVAGADAIDLMRQLGNKAGALPFNVVLDRRGAVVATRLGAYQAAELREVLTRMLG
jgi:thiol-disulfide isomerase/thioredoxin